MAFPFLIIEDDLNGDRIQNLLQIHAEGMLANSPEGSCHFLDLSELRLPEVTVWSIWERDELAGCGALREIDASHGEVKSMRTVDEHLGKGVGRQMLEHLVDTARGRGYQTLSLETGSTAAFAAAINLYEGFGFQACGPFDSYEPNSFSRFYALHL